MTAVQHDYPLYSPSALHTAVRPPCKLNELHYLNTYFINKLPQYTTVFKQVIPNKPVIEKTTPKYYAK